jgi:uncharacterized protein (TIGR02147 family)
MNEQITVQHLLRKKLAEAQTRNPTYTLRAFANRLKLGAGALSAIMNGKRRVSLTFASRLADKLMLDPQEREDILSRFPEKNPYTKVGDKADHVSASYLTLSALQFRIVAQWEHMAILSLMNTKEFKSETEWIANRLGISQTVARQAIDRLVSVGMIEKDESGQYKRSNPHFSTTDGLADISIKKAHEESLDLARKSLHEYSVKERDMCSTTMAIDPSRLDEAKVLIREFQDKLAALLESGERTEVYQLATQLFPLTKIHTTNHGEQL